MTDIEGVLPFGGVVAEALTGVAIDDLIVVGELAAVERLGLGAAQHRPIAADGPVPRSGPSAAVVLVWAGGGPTRAGAAIERLLGEVGPDGLVCAVPDAAGRADLAALVGHVATLTATAPGRVAAVAVDDEGLVIRRGEEVLGADGLDLRRDVGHVGRQVLRDV